MVRATIATAPPPVYAVGDDIKCVREGCDAHLVRQANGVYAGVVQKVWPAPYSQYLSIQWDGQTGTETVPKEFVAPYNRPEES